VEYELAVVEQGSTAVAGSVGLYINESRTQGMIGYCLAKPAWGRGIATEAAGALLRLAFEDLRVHRVWSSCDPDNAASRRVLEKVGMRHEGHQRESAFVRGGFRDRLLFGILRREWSERD
jgi:ribosomal-protein-alanine N-acetyltransferase